MSDEFDNLNTNIESIKKRYSEKMGSRDDWLKQLNENPFYESGFFIKNISGKIRSLRSEGLQDASMDFEMFFLFILSSLYGHMQYDFKIKQFTEDPENLQRFSKKLALFVLNNNIKSMDDILEHPLLDEFIVLIMCAEEELQHIAYRYEPGW